MHDSICFASYSEITHQTKPIMLNAHTKYIPTRQRTCRACRRNQQKYRRHVSELTLLFTSDHCVWNGIIPESLTRSLVFQVLTRLSKLHLSWGARTACKILVRGRASPLCHGCTHALPPGG